MKRMIFYPISLLLATCLLFSSCASPKATNTPKTTNTPKATQTDVTRPVRVALTQDLLSFDPMMTSDIFSEAVLRCIYTSLYDFDEQLQLRPKLVKTSTVIDSTTWEITIHDGVTFHDGTPLTTEDVIFSIERAMQGGRTQKLLEVIQKLEKIDDTTFRLYANEPYTDLLSIFAKAETSIVSKAVVEQEGYDFSVPVGAGPFQLLDRKVGSSISLERYEGCYLGDAASKYLEFVVIVTEQERTAAFLNGDVDVLFSVSAYDCDKLRISKDVQLFQTPSTKIEYLSLNNNRPPLDNPKVRSAISYAINRDQIVNEVYHSYAIPNSSVIPPGITGYVESPITYDTAKAKALLEEAGYKDGFSFTVITIDTIRKNTLEYIKLNLAQIGIDLNYNLVTMDEAVQLMTAGEHDGILVGWAFNSDPNSVLPLLLGTDSGKTMNSSNYSNPLADELMQQGRIETDEVRQQEIYEELGNILIADAPIVVLLNPMISCAARTNIDGVYINPQGLFQYESLYRK